MVHVNGLPPDSALVRKRQNAPMGWDNTAEMTATVVDAINILTRHYINAHSESPIDPLPLMPRPYEAAVIPVVPVVPVAASLGDLNAWLSEGD